MARKKPYDKRTIKWVAAELARAAKRWRDNSFSDIARGLRYFRKDLLADAIELERKAKRVRRG